MASNESNPVTSLFQGYDTFASSGMTGEDAVQGTTTPAGSFAQCNYSVCTSYTQVQTALNISASVSTMFGFGSASLKTSFAESLKVTTFSVTVVVYSCTGSEVTASGTTLINAPPSPTGLNAFCNSYGDCFVSALTKGGEYMAGYVFYAQSQQEQESIISTLSANAIGEGGSLDASFQENFNTAATQISFNFNFQSLMTGFTPANTPTLPGYQEMVPFALNFSTLTPDAPVAILFGTTGYEEVLPQGLFGPVVSNRQWFQDPVEASPPGLSASLATLSQVNNQITQINEIYGTYGYTGDTQLNPVSSGTMANQVQTDINSLANLIYAANTGMNFNPANTYPVQTYPSLSYGSPYLNVGFPSQPTWGTSPGTPFQDITPYLISSQTILSNLQIWGGAWVNMLICTYKSANPNQPTTFPHGQSGGTESVPLNLQGGEYITSISGTSLGYVTLLTFKTSKGQDLTWPPDSGSATPFNWEVPDGSVLVGFQGSSGEYLNQLSPIVCTFSPATWTGTS